MNRFKFCTPMWTKHFLSVVVLLAPLHRAWAGNWGVSAGYNNPPGSSLGVSLLGLWDVFGFEAGIGGIQADSNKHTTGTGVYGDVDIKATFGKEWRGLAEVGMRAALGVRAGDGAGASAGANSLFVGAGVLYWGSKFFCYGKYNVDADNLNADGLKNGFPAFGFGIRL